MIKYLAFLIVFSGVYSLPLKKDSIFTLQIPDNNNTVYKPIFVKEWFFNNTSWVIHQTWNYPFISETNKSACTILDIDGHGKIVSLYPANNEIWFLCKNASTNSTVNNNSSLIISRIQENGDWYYWNKINYFQNDTLDILPYIENNNINILYQFGKDILLQNLTNATNFSNFTLNMLNNTFFKFDKIDNEINQTLNISKNEYFNISKQDSFYKNTSFHETDNIIWCQLNNKLVRIILDNINNHILYEYHLIPDNWKLIDGRFENNVLYIYISNSTHIAKNSYDDIINNTPFKNIIQVEPGFKIKSIFIRDFVSINPTVIRNYPNFLNNNKTLNQTNKQSNNQTNNQSINQTNSQSNNQIINQTNNQTNNQSNNQTNNQTINQTINQSGDNLRKNTKKNISMTGYIFTIFKVFIAIIVIVIFFKFKSIKKLFFRKLYDLLKDDNKKTLVINTDIDKKEISQNFSSTLRRRNVEGVTYIRNFILEPPNSPV